MAAGTAQQQSLVDLWYQWAYGVLGRIGAPTSQTNIQTLWNWSIKESGATPIVNGSIVNNPLNTTQPEPGSVSRNSAGVQSYPDVSTGVAGTSQTLLNGRYPDIVQALRNSVPAPQWGSNPAIVSQLNTWGSHSNWLSWNNAPPQPSSQFQNTTENPSTFTNSTPGSDPISSAINSALSPIGNAITGAENNLVQTATYLLLIGIGISLMILGVAVLFLGSIQRPLSAVTGAAANATPEGKAVSVGAAAVKAKESPPPSPAPAPKAPAAAPAPQTRQQRNAELERGISEGKSFRELRKK